MCIYYHEIVQSYMITKISHIQEVFFLLIIIILKELSKVLVKALLTLL